MGTSSIPLEDRSADELEMELAFGEDSELSIGDAIALAEEDQEDEHGGTAEAASEDDEREGLTSEVFWHLRYREREFENAYPFRMVTKRGLTQLTQNVEKGHDKLLYLFLLACSHVGKFKKSEENKLTNIFEEVCVPVAASYLNGEAERFGAAGKGGERRFDAKLKDSLPQLADYLDASPIPGNIAEVENNNTGDAGIDIVARVPFPGNDLFGMLAALGQCTCSANGWKKKVRDAHSVFNSQYFLCKHPPLNFFFVPFFWRNTDGKWPGTRKQDLHSSIPFDRLRICRLLAGKVTDELAAAMKACLETQPELIGYSA